MKYVILCLGIFTLLGCTDDNVKSAGVIAYAEKEGERYILLADHTGASAHRGYGAFGGGLDDGETFEEGALREFHEETACHFVGKVESISEDYVRNKKYVSFVVKIPFIEEAVLNQGPNKAHCDGGVYSERTNWIWVKQQLLLEQIQLGNHYKSGKLDISLWDKSTIILKKLQQADLL